MVGMNNRSGEPRRSGGSQTAKKDRPSAVEQSQHTFPNSQSQMPKPSAEQVHIAQMFEDKTPEDIDKRIAQVMAVVEGKDEEGVSVALHDHDYCVEKAIEALLDSVVEEQWEVKKSKKKGQADYTQEPANSSSDTRTKGTSRGASNKSMLRAASHTRETYGGNVTVTTNHIDSRDRDSRDRGRRNRIPAQGGGRSARSGGSRSDNSSSGGRRDRSDKDRGNRTRRRDREKGPLGSTKFNGRMNHHKMEGDGLEENVDLKHRGGFDYSGHNSIHHTEEAWRGTPGSGGQWDDPDEEQPAPLTERNEQPVPHEWSKETDLGSVFPDAIPANQLASEHKLASHSEERPSGSASPHSPNAAIAPSSMRTFGKAVPKTKQRRYMPSQIPSQPVEMPVGVDPLILELSGLGIGFGGETEEERAVASSTPGSTIISSHHQQYEEVVVSSPQPATVHQPLPLPVVASYTQSLPEDPSAVIVSTNLATSYKEPSTKLEPPPGLTHPSHHADKSSSQLLPTPTEPLSRHTHNPGPQPTASELGNLLNTNAVTLPHPTSTATLALSGMDLLGTRSEAATTMPLPTVANSGSATVSYTTASATPTSAEVLFSSQPATTVPPPQATLTTTAGTGSITSSSIPATVPAAVPGGAGIKSSSSHSSGSKSHSSSVPHATGMVYPHQMMPHFPAPYGNAPMMMPTYPYDIDSLNRYPNAAAGYYGQHTTSQEQGALASAVNRDHTSNAFVGPGENKFDVTSPLTSSNPSQQQQQQQQQQGSLQQPNQLGPPFYPYNFMYSNMMYNPHLSMAQFSQPMGHKPGGSSSYPVVSTYQTTAPAAEFNLYGATGDLGSASGLEYKAGYPLSKSTNVPTATSSTGSDYYKQYENKSTAGYGNFVPAQYGFFPPMMPPMMHTHDSTSSRGKHNKGYHGGAGMGWAAQQHNA